MLRNNQKIPIIEVHHLKVERTHLILDDINRSIVHHQKKGHRL